jgi:hypothetical protein
MIVVYVMEIMPVWMIVLSVVAMDVMSKTVKHIQAKCLIVMEFVSLM